VDESRRSSAGTDLVRIEPELLQILRKLAEDVPGLASRAGRAAEGDLQDREHGAYRALGLGIVRKVGEAPHAADELVAMQLLHAPGVALVVRPEMAEVGRHLSGNVRRLLGSQAIAQRLEHRDDHSLGALPVAAQSLRDVVDECSALHGSLFSADAFATQATDQAARRSRRRGISLASPLPCGGSAPRTNRPTASRFDDGKMQHEMMFAPPQDAPPGLWTSSRPHRQAEPPEIAIQPFLDERMSTLTYLVYDERSLVGVVIDPVTDFEPRRARLSNSSNERVAAAIDRIGIDLQYVLETQVHVEHFTGISFFQDRYGAHSVVGSRVGEVQRAFRDCWGLGDALPVDGRQFDVLLGDGAVLKAGRLRI